MKQTRLMTAVAGLAIAAVAAFIVVAGAASQAGSPVLQTVSASTLRARGISLAAPTNEAPAITAAAAVTTAGKVWGTDTQIREEVLASVTDVGSPGMDGRLCWVLSLMPKRGIPIPGGGRAGDQVRPQPATYLLEFVDAQTGADLYGISGGQH
jgi:hypothetical protein